jgi:serine/threonine protein kinase
MICCLNPGCTLENPSCPDAVQYCTSCGTKLVLLSDRYCPVSRIGEGGFGVTYLAQDRQRFNKDCVIKQLIVHNSKAKELFEQEAKQLEHLGSQCSQIPRLLAYPSDKQYLYLVQEFIAGQNLEKYLADNGVQNEEQIKDFLNTLLPVLELIHKNKIIHRDIKLDNIMRRDDGQLVLIDFGIAKQFIDNNTPIPGTIAGTPGYAPSEQMIQGIAYPSSDLYSLGVVCFSLLTGKNPYIVYQNFGFSWTSKWQQYLPKPISPGLAKIIDKMLQEKYQNRYQSAADVIRALQDLKPLNPDPQKTVRVNSSGNLPPKTRWINFYTLLLGAGVSFILGAVTFFYQLQNIPNGETYYQSGQELAGKDDKWAIEAFTKAIKLKPDYVSAYNDRGLSRYETGDSQGAIDDYDRAIKLKPDNHLSYTRRGYAFSSLGNGAKAIDDWKFAIKLKPDSSDTYCSRGYAKFGLGDIKGAIEDYTQAIKLKSDSSSAYNNRGIARSKLGDKKGAIEDYTQAIKLKPDLAYAYNNRGYAKSKLGDKKGAIEDYTQAIKLKPYYTAAYLNRGNSQSDLGDKKGAIEDYNQTRKIFKQGIDVSQNIDVLGHVK